MESGKKVDKKSRVWTSDLFDEDADIEAGVESETSIEGTGCLRVHGKPSLNLNRSIGWF